MKKHERDFKGVWIPKEIWLNEELTLIEKCLLVEIDSLDNDSEKGCYASNEYLSEFVNMKEKTVKNILTGLKKKGYLQQIYFNGRVRGLRVSCPEFRTAEVPHKGQQKSQIQDAPVPNSGQQTAQIQDSPIYRTINTVINTDITTTKRKKEKIVDVDPIENCLSDSVNQNRTTALEIQKEKRTPELRAAPLTFDSLKQTIAESQILIETAAKQNKLTIADAKEKVSVFVDYLESIEYDLKSEREAKKYFLNWLPVHITKQAESAPKKGRIASINENTRSATFSILNEIAQTGKLSDPLYDFKT